MTTTTTPKPKFGECEDCGKWLPGQRRVCGRCYVKRDQARHR